MLEIIMLQIEIFISTSSIGHFSSVKHPCFKNVCMQVGVFDDVAHFYVLRKAQRLCILSMNTTKSPQIVKNLEHATSFGAICYIINLYAA